MSTEHHKPDMLYGIDDVPPLWESVTLGFQHYLTMFGSTVAIPLILSKPLGLHPLSDPKNALLLGMLISTMFFVSGITTLLQTTIGNRLPIVQGGTFSFLVPAIAICGMAGVKTAGFDVKMQHLQGAIIIGAVFQIIIGYTGLVGRLLRYITPVTIAPTIALIGLSLFKFGAPVAGLHWGIGGLTLFAIIFFSQYLRTRHRIFELFPILLGICLAWGVAALCTAMGWFPGPTIVEGKIVAAAHPAFVDTSKLAAAPWFRVPTPFQWGWPQFGIAATVGMFAGYVASMVESIGDYYACARLSGAPVPTETTINRGIGMEGVGCLVAGVIGTGNGTTSYSENIGAIGLTRVGSRRVVQIGALLMLVLGMFGKFGALFTTIPQPIVGGMYCAMFGMIAAVGLSNLQFVNLNAPRNLFILGFAFFMGLSVPEYFNAHPLKWAGMLDMGAIQLQWQAFADLFNTVGKTGMAVGAFSALILDNTIPGTDQERGITAWSRKA